MNIGCQRERDYPCFRYLVFWVAFGSELGVFSSLLYFLCLKIDTSSRASFTAVFGSSIVSAFCSIPRLLKAGLFVFYGRRRAFRTQVMTS